jgi:hypothetical protein
MRALHQAGKNNLSVVGTGFARGSHSVRLPLTTASWAAASIIYAINTTLNDSLCVYCIPLLA